MSAPARAVFLSYASQDAEAVRRLSDALRTAGVEVWFDADGGLEHGDEWDAKIRRQIKECVLFIPFISANTQARHEGYFRIEWELAAQRALGIASGVPFILPVVIDDTREPDALVPDRFRTVQWTRLRGGELPPDVLQRFLKLWSHRIGAQKGVSPIADSVAAGAPTLSAPTPENGRRRAWWPVALAGLVVLGGGAWWLTQHRAPAPSDAPRTTALAAATTGESVSEARQLARRAQAIIDTLDSTRDDYQLAEELIQKAKAKDNTDAEICAIEAQIHQRFIQRYWDGSDARREAARSAASRAIRLDPQSFEARLAQVGLLGTAGREAEERERLLRDLRRERPTDQRVLRALASILGRTRQLDEAAKLAHESAALPGGDPLALYDLSQSYWFAGHTAEAEAALDASLAQKPFTGALLLDVWYKTALRGDIAGARQSIERVNPTAMLEDRAAYFAYYTELLGRAPDKAIAWMRAVPRDWLNDAWFRGPKTLLIGNAHHSAGREDAARIEWQSALKLVEQRLANDERNPAYLSRRVELLARLGHADEARRQLDVLMQIAGGTLESSASFSADVTLSCILLGRKTEALRQMRALIRSNANWSVVYSSAILRLDPDYAALQGDPDFDAIIAEVAAHERNAATPESPQKNAALAPSDEKSVAVLAFANLSDDKANEYFSDGISEELLNVLAKVPGLKVSARTSAFYFKGKDTPIPDIAQKLGVAYVVEGSVRKAGDKVRITAQLIKAADGFHVWSDTFTRELKDVFAVQDEIAGLIARNLQLRLGEASGAKTTAPAAVGADELEAYRLYWEAREAWNRRNAAGFDRAETLLERAIQLAPRFAKAHAALADVWELRGEWDNALGPFANRNSELAQRILRKVEEALAIDPLCAEAHASRGLIAWNSWQFEAAEQSLREAIRLNPNYASAHQWLARAYMIQGRLDEALASFARAAELDPLSPRILDNYAWGLLHAGRRTEALAFLDRALALQPDAVQPISLKARILAQDGKKDEAAALERSVPRGVWISSHFRALALGFIGDAEAKSRLEALLTDRNYVTSFTAQLALGRTDEALDQLVPERFESTRVDLLLFDPFYDRVRRDPRFLRALDAIGLSAAHARAQAWRAAHLSAVP